MSTGWEAQISDDAAKIMWRLAGDHGPGKHAGWCGCGAWACGRGQEFGTQLEIAGRERPRWAVQGGQGRLT